MSTDDRDLPVPGDCNCPKVDGMFYHQRATCTDGIIAWFGWYADEEPEPPGTIEAIVAASVEQRAPYMTELLIPHGGFDCWCGRRVTECDRTCYAALGDD